MPTCVHTYTKILLEPGLKIPKILARVAFDQEFVSMCQNDNFSKYPHTLLGVQTLCIGDIK